MTFKLIKAGSYTYKREGKRRTAYRVRCRQDGFAIDQPIKDASNDTEAIKAAKQIIAKTRLDAIRDKNRRRYIPEMVRISDLAEEVIAAKPWGPTRKDARHFVDKRILPWFNANCPFITNFTEATWDDFCAWHQINRPGQKIFNPRKYMMQIVKRAQKKGLLRLNISLKNPDPKRKRGKVFSDDELAALYKKCPNSDTELQFLMACTMGMRKSEILRLQWSRIHFEKRTIALLAEDCKIRDGREFQMTDEVSRRLQKLWGERGIKSEFVFPSRVDRTRPVQDNKSAWQKAKRLAKVKGRFHDLRHTFITQQVARDKRQAIDVAIYCGLSLEELKRTYLHPTYQDTAYIAEGQNSRMEKILGKTPAGVENA